METESEDEEEQVVKRNPDTDANNPDFERHLADRRQMTPTNFLTANKEYVHSLNRGRPLKPRIDVPEGVEVYPYGNQKMNIWEIQKEKLRETVANDPSHFYTYSKEYLSQSFPLVNENLIAVKAKQENEARWKTKNGFDNLDKNLNWNEHPKRPHPSKMDDLMVSYVQQKQEMKEQLQGKKWRPEDEGKEQFKNKVKGGDSFSDPSYFKTVFISGDDMVKEMAELK